MSGDTVRDRKHFDEVLNQNNTSSAEKAECEELTIPIPYLWQRPEEVNKLRNGEAPGVLAVLDIVGLS